MSQKVSEVSAIPIIREYMVRIQRSFTKNNSCVMEGRDIGTEIFPKARIKIFMWADAKVRAKRRHLQIKKKGQITSLKRIYKEIVARDMNDLNRKIAPLRPAVNSVLLDTSYLDIEQAFNAIKEYLVN